MRRRAALAGACAALALAGPSVAADEPDLVCALAEQTRAMRAQIESSKASLEALYAARRDERVADEAAFIACSSQASCTAADRQRLAQSLDDADADLAELTGFMETLDGRLEDMTAHGARAAELAAAAGCPDPDDD